MNCPVCGGKTWTDDDLHWLWCFNLKCAYSYDDRNSRKLEYNQELDERERDSSMYEAELNRYL